MILVVAEKPSVARDIARVLKAGRKEGYFESDTHRVTWALGHLVTLMEPDEIDEKYKKWRREDLPILPDTLGTKVIPKTRAQFSLIKKLMLNKDTDSIVAATDAGREGELIFRLIYQKAGCTKPVERLWISSLTDAAIREGFDSLKPASEYEGLYQSALCRAQADWLVGMNASRAFTLRYNALLSVGRVQTPTLAILVEREKEIRQFVPQTFAVLTADFGDYKGRWLDPSSPEERTAHRIADKARAQQIAREVKGRPARVTMAETQPKRELPPQLFDLTSLQRDANRLLGFTADKTLKVAQSLYEDKKALTYPRTDSRYLPRDMIPRVGKALGTLPEPYQTLARGIQYKEGKPPFTPRVYDDKKVTDHHAIIPTPQTPRLDSFTADEKALYDLVVRRFVGVFYPAFEYDQTTVITQSQGHSFKSSGRVVTREGWKAVIREEEPKKKKKNSDEEEEQAGLPPLAVGDERTVVSATVREETTKPPPPHTDASLLARMERPGALVEDEELMETLKKNGLGTPATRAAIIERLIQVGYAGRRGKALFATEKGEKLIAVVPEDIASPVLTGKWEQALNEIAQQQREPARFMEGIRRLTVHLVQYADTQSAQVEFSREIRGKSGKVKAVQTASVLEGVSCPLCGQPVQQTDRAFGCSDWKNGCRFTLWKNALTRAKGPLLNERIVKTLLEKGEVQGSTGVIALKDGRLLYTQTGEKQPSVSVPIAYEGRKAASTPGTNAGKGSGTGKKSS